MEDNKSNVNLPDHISVDDILSFGNFDGSFEETMSAVYAFTYIAPFTWTLKKNKNGDIKAILFYKKSKTELMDEGIKASKKTADIVLNVGDKWATYMTELEDRLNTGIIELDDETFAKVIANEASKLTFDEFLDAVAEANGAFVLRFDDDGNPIVPDELKDELDPTYLKYALEAQGITAGGK